LAQPLKSGMPAEKIERPPRTRVAAKKKAALQGRPPKRKKAALKGGRTKKKPCFKRGKK